MRQIVVIFLFFSLLSLPTFGQTDEDYIRWAKEYEKAKARLRTWDAIEIGGAAAAVVGIALYFVDQEETDYSLWGTIYTEKKKRPGYLIAGAVGAGMGLIGFLLAEPARWQVKALEVEGRERGYLTLSVLPTYQGLAISLKLSF